MHLMKGFQTLQAICLSKGLDQQDKEKQKEKNKKEMK